MTPVRVVGTTNHKPTVNSAVHPSEVGKGVLRSNSEGTSSNASGPHQLYSCYTQPALTNEIDLLYHFPIFLARCPRPNQQRCRKHLKVGGGEKRARSKTIEMTGNDKVWPQIMQS